MRRALIGAGLLFITAVTAPAQERPKGLGPSSTASARDYRALAVSGAVVGKVVRASPGDRSLTLRVEYPALRQGGAAQVAGRPRDRASRLRAAAENKDFDLKSIEGVHVRSATLPAAFDDKGFLKKYTAEEKKALKGTNPALPGYAVTFDDLKPGDLVRVTFKRAGAGKDGDPAPAVSVVLILQETADPALARAGQKPRKNK